MKKILLLTGLIVSPYLYADIFDVQEQQVSEAIIKKAQEIGTGLIQKHGAVKIAEMLSKMHSLHYRETYVPIEQLEKDLAIYETTFRDMLNKFLDLYVYAGRQRLNELRQQGVETVEELEIHHYGEKMDVVLEKQIQLLLEEVEK